MPFSNIQSSGGSIAIKDEGLTIAAAAASIDFVGSGVSGAAIGQAVTETISGGGSGTLASESAIESPDNNNVTFTFAHNVGVVSLNGLAQYVGGNLLSVSTVTAVFNTAPFTGDEIRNIYTA